MSEATVALPFMLAERAPQKASFDARSEEYPDNPLQLRSVEEIK
ncbi:MAG: hypothetical protein ACKVP8_08125 [Nitrospiraceae bacterium]